MKQKIKIGNYEACCLLLNMICYKIILSFPRVVAEYGGTAGWLLTMFSSVIGILLFYVISGLYKQFAGNDILDIAEIAFGIIGKIIVALFFLVLFLTFVPVFLREFAEDIKIISLTNTPISIITLIFCIGMVVGSYLGIETLVRIHALTVPFIAGAFVLILLLTTSRFDISNLAPWLGLGADVIIKEGISNLSMYSEFIVLLFIVPLFHKKSDFINVGRYSLMISGFFLVLSSLCYMLVFQYPASTEYFLPMYQMARIIRLGRFFTRIESAFIVIWASSAFLFLSCGLYFITFLFQKAFNLNYYKPLIFPFTVMVFTLSMVPENLYSALLIEMEYYRRYSWILTFLLPILLLLAANIRTRIKAKKGAMAR
ncbi:MAG: endospore germination permease [Clostridiales bacterium]|nr:endospore germination permease [Clostridiales bacterium]